MKHTTDFFIKKFESIPESMWCTEYYSVKKWFFSKRRFCAQGFCMPLYVLKIIEQGVKKNKMVAINFFYLREYQALINLVPEIGSINNGTDPFYKQLTPKERVIARLYDKKADEAVMEANEIINPGIKTT